MWARDSSSRIYYGIYYDEFNDYKRMLIVVGRTSHIKFYISLYVSIVSQGHFLHLHTGKKRRAVYSKWHILNWRKMAQPYWGARGLRFLGVKAKYMPRPSTINYNPRATGSLRHFMLNAGTEYPWLKVFCAVLKTASLSVNSSIRFLTGTQRDAWVSANHWWCFTVWNHFFT